MIPKNSISVCFLLIWRSFHKTLRVFSLGIMQNKTISTCIGSFLFSPRNAADNNKMQISSTFLNTVRGNRRDVRYSPYITPWVDKLHKFYELVRYFFVFFDSRKDNDRRRYLNLFLKIVIAIAILRKLKF